MLLERCRMQLANPPCNPSAETVNAIVEFEDDLTELLPYLNAQFGPGMYDADVPFLRLSVRGKVVTIHPKMIAVSNLSDEGEAREVVDWLRDTINAVAARKGRIEPCCKSIGDVKALHVFKLLSGSNCGQCGYATCLAFSAAVAGRQAYARQCAPLFSGDREQQRRALLGLLGQEDESR